jgi:hypothetical protein
MSRMVPRTLPGPEASVRYPRDVTRSMPLGRLLLADFEGSVPWRVFRSRHGQAHLSGSYWAATTGGHVVYESRLELARLLLADFDREVTSVYAQPCLLAGVAGGRARRHVPDFLLGLRAGAVRVVNVKPASRLADPKIAEELAWPGELFRAHGWDYQVWSGEGHRPQRERRDGRAGRARAAVNAAAGAGGRGRLPPQALAVPASVPRWRSGPGPAGGHARRDARRCRDRRGL